MQKKISVYYFKKQHEYVIKHISYYHNVAYRPTARQQLDKHLPAETESWQTARCYVNMFQCICNNRGHSLLGNGRIFYEVGPDAL
jgi:hypothetical protein